MEETGELAVAALVVDMGQSMEEHLHIEMQLMARMD
jgi:hypothetical protein